MSKSREKIQQLGFWDPEVSNPNHDQVCLWAYKNSDSIARRVFPHFFDCAWTESEVLSMLTSEISDFAELARKFSLSTSRPNPRVHRRTIEYVLRTYTGYNGHLERIVGYGDLLIEMQFPCVCPKFAQDPKRTNRSVFDGFEVGWSAGQESNSILVEAKSILPTVGEIMRQVQLYRSAFRGRIVIVCPDDRYEDILREQNVGFIKCDSLFERC